MPLYFWRVGYQLNSFLWKCSYFVVVQSPSHVQLFATPWNDTYQLLCPSPSPSVCPSSCSLYQWCHPAISSSVIPFSSCFQFFPASGSFPMSWLCIRWPKDWSFSFSISSSNTVIQASLWDPAVNYFECIPRSRIAGVYMLSRFRCVQLFATLGITAQQTSLSVGFSSKNTGVGCQFLLQGIFLN